MGLPTITVEVAFTTAPAATPTWTDISSYVRGLSTNRGRQHELDRPGAGTAQIVLDNRDQRFDPNNTAGPYQRTALDLPGASGDYADTADPGLSGSFELSAFIQCDDYTAGVQGIVLLGKSGTTGWGMWLSGSGNLVCRVRHSSTNYDHTSSAAVTSVVSDGDPVWVRATFDHTVGDVTFYTGGAGESPSWVQLGTTQSSAAAGVDAQTASTVKVGSGATGGGSLLTGSVYVARVHDGIDGPKVIDADFRLASAGAASFTDNTGTNTVTVQGNASITDTGTPMLRPLRRVRIQATWSAVTYDLFTGYVEAWPQSYEGPSDAYVTLSCVDGFKVLNLQQISATYSQEAAGTRIGNVLDDAGWPAADRDIDTGQSTIAADTITDSALSHIADVEQAELGLFFMAGNGDATFVDRHAFVQATLDTANDTWVDADSGAGNLYADVTVLYDDTDIWNDIRVSRDGGGSQTVTDATSITRYFTRTLTSHQNLIVSSDDALTDHANALLTRYSEPALRIVNMTVLPQADDSWANLLSYDLATKVRVKRDPPGAGDTITQDSWIEGISHRVRPGEWVTVLNLSPVDRTTDYWVLGTSELGTSTRLGF